MEKYTLGIDFGTQSGRAIVVRLSDGLEMAVSVLEYPHGVMTEELVTGEKLPASFALQHPQDYLTVLATIIPEALSKAQISAEQVVGLGIAVTSSTILPVLADGTPLCFLPEFARDPHSWIKLWKHHGAQPEALELDQFLQEHAPGLSAQFGGTSAERLLPKAVEVKRKSPNVYAKTYAFLEVADWLVWQLTGELQRSAPIAGYKSMWRKSTGYLTPKLLDKINLDFAEVIEEKLPGDVISMGLAGMLLPKFAKQYGLKKNTRVATGYIDAHSAVLGSGICEVGRLVMVMGTTTCHLLLSEELALVEGMSGAVHSGIVNELYAYESGQSSVGDQFAWFVENCVPQAYVEMGESTGLGIFGYLEKLARNLSRGQTGLLALDWWNGNRSILNNASLSGLLLGLTTRTKPEEIYLALLESTAFGAKQIMDSFLDNGLTVDTICVCGGLPRKNELLMQIYADVMNRTIEVAQSKYTSALGAAIWAAVAAGPNLGGYATVNEATQMMTSAPVKRYKPQPEIVKRYEKYYAYYKQVHDYFGREAVTLMESLKHSQKE